MSKCVRSQKREARRYKKELKMYLTVWEEEAANIKEFWRLLSRGFV